MISHGAHTHLDDPVQQLVQQPKTVGVLMARIKAIAVPNHCHMAPSSSPSFTLLVLDYSEDTVASPRGCLGPSVVGEGGAVQVRTRGHPSDVGSMLDLDPEPEQIGREGGNRMSLSLRMFSDSNSRVDLTAIHTYRQVHPPYLHAPVDDGIPEGDPIRGE